MIVYSGLPEHKAHGFTCALFFFALFRKRIRTNSFIYHMLGALLVGTTLVGVDS
jgi:hypothetical protein